MIRLEIAVVDHLPTAAHVNDEAWARVARLGHVVHRVTITPSYATEPANWDTPGSVWSVTEVAVLLTWVDHTCCGPVRGVGDTFASSIHNYQGLIYEERHPSGVSIATFPMTGRITGIAWRPDSGGTYGPATAIASTDDLPDNSDWILEFTVETSGAIPEPRTDFL